MDGWMAWLLDCALREYLQAREGNDHSRDYSDLRVAVSPSSTLHLPPPHRTLGRLRGELISPPAGRVDVPPSAGDQVLYTGMQGPLRGRQGKYYQVVVSSLTVPYGRSRPPSAKGKIIGLLAHLVAKRPSLLHILALLAFSDPTLNRSG